MDRRTFVRAASTGIGLTAAVLGCASAQAQSVAASPPLARPASGLIRVACAVSEATTSIDYIGPEAVFQTWHRDPVTGRHAKQFEIFTVAASREPVSGIVPTHTFADVPSPHVVVVPAQQGSPELIEWLRGVHRTADVTMSVCLGARFLARAGLLDGRQATTHHASIDDFAREFPNTTWVRNVRFVESEKVSTSGGLTSGIDLALHVVERYFDRVAAQGVADHLEYEGVRWKV